MPHLHCCFIGAPEKRGSREQSFVFFFFLGTTINKEPEGDDDDGGRDGGGEEEKEVEGKKNEGRKAVESCHRMESAATANTE